jgi:hypothetical protein
MVAPSISMAVVCRCSSTRYPQTGEAHALALSFA